MNKILNTKIYIILLSVIFFYSCAHSNKSDQEIQIDNIKKNDSVVEKEEPIKFNKKLTDIANFIALNNLSDSLNNIVSNNKELNELKIETDTNYNIILKERLNKMENWNMAEYIGDMSVKLPVFYPFSGPDFIHVNYLYPNSDTFILTKKKKIGKLPDFESLSTKSSEKYLQDINFFMRDIYLRGYFITKRMKVDLKETSMNGLIGSLYWFISRTNHKIVSQKFVTIDANGEMIDETNVSNGWLKDDHDGVAFELIDKNGKKKNLIYFSADISNEGLTDKNPELKKYLDKMEASNTFVKSASYLMHYRSFSMIRDIVLDRSYSFFQDDTGVPYKYFNNDNWTTSLFGRYVNPIKDFESTMSIITQEDLRNAYDDNSLNKGYLPFSLGYHWRNRKNQNQQFSVKKN